MINFIRICLNLFSSFITVLIVGLLFVELAFLLTISSYDLFEAIHYYIFLVLFMDVIIRLIIRPEKSFGYFRILIGLLSILPLLSFYGVAVLPFDINFGLQQIILVMIVMTRLQHFSFLFSPFRINPAQSFIAGFALSILIGAIFLSLPISHNQELPFIDALYTAASAVCVTGLTVFNVGDILTPFGVFILLLLIQIGGLGIMTFYALVTISLNNRFLSKESKALQDGWATESSKETFGIIKVIFLVTFILEIIGAICIFPYMSLYTNSFLTQMYYAFFHSVSAFCNAGFSLFSNGFMIFYHSSFLMLIFSILILVGGIGFPVILQLYHRFILKSKYRLKVQTKLALWVSFMLIFIGTAVIYFNQLYFTDLPISFISALFQSISARTAGFSVVDMTLLHPASLWVVIILMFVGASPGSTGGGIKTTTFGLLIMALVSIVKSEDKIKVFDRHISPNLVFKAVTILMLSLFILFFSFFILLITESIGFFELLFETVSAFATVGFSLGVSEQMTSIGKFVIIILMFFGRVGPLALAIALMRRSKVANYKLPEEHILLG